VVKVHLNVDTLLQGPDDKGTGLMNNAPRANALVPLAEHYNALD